jgi:hypothetical protein
MTLRPSMQPRETRSEALARWEREGFIARDCKGCEEFYDTPEYPWAVFAPRHTASPRCESGSRAHCSCGICW